GHVTERCHAVSPTRSTITRHDARPRTGASADLCSSRCATVELAWAIPRSARPDHVSTLRPTPLVADPRARARAGARPRRGRGARGGARAQGPPGVEP